MVALFAKWYLQTPLWFSQIMQTCFWHFLTAYPILNIHSCNLRKFLHQNFSTLANREYFIVIIKGPMFSEKILASFPLPKNVLRSIQSFVFWIFLHSDTAVQLESADSIQNTISKSLFRIVFGTLFEQWEKCIIFLKKATFRDNPFCNVKSPIAK